VREALRDIEERPFDLVVLGAGINGAGIARDAAMRGLRVLLLEKHDVASGTTSRSTRLIHGGLRYLEHYEIGLVREALKEREVQLRIAPHLVHPLSFLIPIYQDFRRGPAMVRIGMVAYDVLSGARSVGRHKMLGPRETRERAPGIAPEGLRGAALYFDAQAEYPERLAVEAVTSARDHGALVLTYARADRLVVDGGRVREVRFTDLLTGAARTARAPVTLNVTGPWVDQLLGLATVPFRRYLGGTKGSHVVVDDFPGAPAEAIYVEARDGRPFFIVPWLGRYLIGTTDLAFEGDLDTLAASDEEIDYLIDSTNRVIPDARLSRRGVLYSYAGVRPLPFEPGAEPGEITRRHIVREHEEVGGLLSVIGGKITTWRELAEEVVDAVFERLGRKDPGCRTDEVPLPGGDVRDFAGFAEDFRGRSALPDRVVDRLLRVYGTRAAAVLDYIDADERLGRLQGESDLLGAEVLYAFHNELAKTIADVLLRRSMVGYEPDLGLRAVEPAARLAGRHLGWDDDRIAGEVERYRAEVQVFRPEVGKLTAGR
jgi:glycerol-3-phosphate dehydrogenase